MAKLTQTEFCWWQKLTTEFRVWQNYQTLISFLSHFANWCNNRISNPYYHTLISKFPATVYRPKSKSSTYKDPRVQFYTSRVMGPSFSPHKLSHNPPQQQASPSPYALYTLLWLCLRPPCPLSTPTPLTLNSKPNLKHSKPPQHTKMAITLCGYNYPLLLTVTVSYTLLVAYTLTLHLTYVQQY